MKTDKFNIHLPEDPCLTEDELHAYISGNASRDTQYRVEAHTVDCALCADALEGFEEKAKRAIVVPTVGKGKVITLFGNRKAVYSAVAGVAIVLGTFFLIKTAALHQETQLAETSKNYATDSFKQGPIPEEISLAEKSEVPVQEQEQQDMLNQTRTQEIGGVGDTTEALIPNRKMEGYKAVPTTVSAADENATILDDVAGDSSGDVDLKQGAPTEKENLEEAVVAQQTNSNSAEQKEAIVIANTAPSSTSAVPQVAAKKDNDQSRAEAPNPNKPSARDLDITYEKGVEFMGQKNYSSAIAFFNQVLVDRQHRYYDDAKWNKAMCLIEQGKKEEARAILKEIEQGNSKYKKDATERLKTL